METIKICPNCRKPLPPDVPLGLCPECLIKSGFPTGTEPGAAGESAGARFVPPPVEEIAQLFPQLEILGFIGKGGMGAVYKARQPALDRFVALKVLPPAVASDPGFAERFNREARALARLNHPNIVAVHDFGKAGTLHYLLMEFVDGTNLREVEHAGQLSPEQALAIVPQICEALQFAHNEGIVHRDIKPENLLLDKKGRVKITDFGIAKIIGAPAGKVALTGVKDVVGTPHYMAPEQIEKPQTVDHRADIYSLGVVFYEMLTGELPLGKFAPPSKKVQIDVRLDEVVLHTLEKEPARRYQQASQLKTDVETIAGAVPPVAGFAAKGGPVPLLATPSGKATSDKIILPAFLLAFFFGVFGAHRFYVGKTGTAILQLCTFGACGIWATIDWILILCKVFTDGQGRRITHWVHPQAGEMKTGVSPLTVPPPTPPSTPPSGGSAPSAAGPTPPRFATTPVPAPAGDPVSGTGIITAPAVALMVAGLWKILSALVNGLYLLPGGLEWLDKIVGGRFFSGWGSVAIISIVLFKLIPGLLILFGGYQMLQRQSYAWAVAAGIIAIVACSLVGLPIGIWALIVLARDDVKLAFGSNVPAAPLAPKSDHFWRHFVVVTGCVILIPIAFAIIAAAVYVLSLSETRGRANDTPQNLPQAGIRQDAGGEFRKDSSQSFPFNADGRFSIDNVKGRIEIHGWSSNAVVINAAIYGKTSESVEAVKINIDSEPNRAVIHTVQPSSVTGFPWSWLWFKNDKRNDASVDYTIQVPQHARLADISSVNGDIVIDGVSGNIAASTVNGDARVKDVAGGLKLSTVNGRIAAEFASLGQGQSVSLDAVNGEIEAALPTGADAKISANTINGGITSEFPSLTVNKELVGKNVNGTLGKGGGSVKVNTVNGNIHFRRGQEPASAETWSPALAPGEKPDLQKILDGAKDLMSNGDYEEALQRYLWYFNHSRNDAGQKGVRISFAISDWMELGRRYPKAKEALIEIRDGDAREFSEGRGYFELFMEVSSINGLLEDDEATYALFKSIGQQDKKLAQQCYGLLEPMLIQRGEYDLCMSYIGDPQARFESICESWERMKKMGDQQQGLWQQQIERLQEMAKTTNSAFPNGPVPFPLELPKFADAGFVAQTRNLIEILVGTGRKADAEKIRGQAVAVLDDPRLKSAVSDAEEEIQKQSIPAGNK